MALVVKCNNSVVTDEYMELIGSSLKTAGHSVKYTNCLNDALNLDKQEVIVVARVIEAYRLIIKGYKKVVVWFQGIEPEESYMAHHSKLRFFVLSYMEKVILRKSCFNFFVSNEMLRHYENKYKIVIDKSRSYVMPCCNTKLHPEAFQSENKYKKNIFVYTGSMAIWQKFEETAKAYKQIENIDIPYCEFWVFTSEKSKAEQILHKYEIKNYKIDYVNNTDLPNALAEAKYGFIIREDTAVNRVATPTKISTYLSCGLIPVYSKCIADFNKIASSMKYVVCYDDCFIEKILGFNREYINNSAVFDEYSKVFCDYYDAVEHKKVLNQLFAKALM